MTAVVPPSAPRYTPPVNRCVPPSVFCHQPKVLCAGCSLFSGKFTVLRRVGAGAFGEVFLARDNEENDLVAIKTCKMASKSTSLFHEANVMQAVQLVATADGLPGMATLLFFGQESQCPMLIMKALGTPLSLLHHHLGRLSLATATYLADEALSRVEHVHSAGYLHRDIKPSNFLFGRLEESRRLFITDFGLAEKYLTDDGKHIPMTSGRSFVGTYQFASQNTHAGLSQSRRDDIEQLVYLFIFLVRGTLPWFHICASSPEGKQEMADLKTKLPIDVICDGCPDSYKEILAYSRRLSYAAHPDYQWLREQLWCAVPIARESRKFLCLDWELPSAHCGSMECG